MKTRIKEPNELAGEHKLSHQTFLSQPRQRWPDMLILIALSAVAFYLVFKGTQLIDPILLDKQALDVWFDGDLPRVFSNMSDRYGSSHLRTNVHPLFSLIAFSPVFLLQQGFSLDPIAAIRIVFALVASLWLAGLFGLLRILGCPRVDAVLFSALATISASAIFWSIVPETYQFGSLSILLALGFAALTEHRQFSSLWYVGVSAFTLSITTTNWMAGILATAVNFSKKQTLQITINAFCLVVWLWAGQKALFPQAAFFLNVKQEQAFIAPFDPAGPLQVFKALVAHTIVMPAINVIEALPTVEKAARESLGLPALSVQSSIPGSGSAWGAIAVVLWTVLLGLGIWGFCSYQRHTKLRIVLGLTLLGQLLLHAVYGTEVFLYSLHFLPLLILLAAFSTFTPARPIALLIAGALVITAGSNNFIQLNQAVELINASQRDRGSHEIQQTSSSLGYEAPDIPRWPNLTARRQ